MTSYSPEARQLAEEFAARCEREGWPVLPGQAVAAEHAARLIGKSPRTLERWRTEDRSIRINGKPRLQWQSSRNGHCTRYLLLELAAFYLRPEV